MAPIKSFPLVLLIFFSVMLMGGRPSNQSSRFSAVILWAWERPEDLRFLNPQRYGVAFLDETIRIGHGVELVRRKQPLRMRLGVKVVSVVRIEAPAGRADLSDPTLPNKLAELIVDVAKDGNASAVQVDFDATKTQRGFYGAMLRRLRHRLDGHTLLSITALASWCAYDDWIAGLPIDEAVPMFFRMGSERFGTHDPDWSYPVREPLCRAQAGISTDEAWPKMPRGTRLYVFHPHPWNPIALSNLEQLLQRQK